MNVINKSVSLHFHADRTQQYGLGSAESLGWGSAERQERRFQELLLIGNLQGCSVLDVGCGYGDLRRHIDRRWPDVNYLGIDQYTPFLEEASRRFADTPDTTFMYGDFISAGLPAVDYVFASGSLSYRSDEPRFIHDAIAKLFGICRRGFAFNLLSEVDETDNVLCAYDPQEIFEICGQWTAQVELREGYLDGDFSVFMRR